jgi:putative ABC transport system permease protein
MMATLAFRNIFRNRARSLITLLTVASGCVFLVLVGGFFADTDNLLRENYIKDFLGHLRIYKKGYLEHGLLHPFDYMMPAGDALRSELLRLPHIVTVAPRLAFAGLVSTGDSTMACLMEGIDPQADRGVREGSRIESGQFLDKHDSFEVILGKGLAAALQTPTGTPVVLLTNTQRGAMNAADVTIKGTFGTASKAFDDHTLRMPLLTAQSLLRTDGIQTWILLLDQTSRVAEVRKSVNALISRMNLDYEVKAWSDLEEADFILKAIEFQDRLFLVTHIMIGIVVILSILNTMNMSVLERVGEIGTMMALGTSRRRVLQMFLIEGFFIGLIGGVIGCFMAGVLGVAISKIGIPMPTAPGSTAPWIGRILLSPSLFVQAFAMALITSLVSAVLPALKAARLEIAEALRHNI